MIIIAIGTLGGVGGSVALVVGSGHWMDSYVITLLVIYEVSMARSIGIVIDIDP
jgi:hypothetical protein